VGVRVVGVGGGRLHALRMMMAATLLAGLAMGPAMEPRAEGQSAGAAGTSGAPSSAGDKAAAGTVPGAPVPQASPTEKLAAIETLVARAHYDEALQQLNAMAGEVPEAAGVERLKGMVYYQTGKLVEADTAFARALQQDPADQVATEMRGMVLFRTGRPAEAIPLLEKANTWLANLNTDANYVLALSYLQTRRYDDARHSLAAVYGFGADSAEAYLLAARLLFRYEYLPVAQEYAERALGMEPKMPLAHQLLGEIALSQGKLDDALVNFQKEKALNPLNPGIYDRLGDLYLRQNQLDEAQKSLNRSVLLDPYSTGPLLLLGKVLLKRGDANMAAGFLEKAARMDPGNYMTHSLLGQAYRMMGQKDRAGKEAEIAEEIQNKGTPAAAVSTGDGKTGK
jgi:predicted Zn-dependent protease